MNTQPEDSQAQHAWMLLERGRPVEAEHAFRGALASQVDEPFLLFGLAISLELQDARDKEALEVIDRAIASYPFAPFFAKKATILIGMDRAKEAVAVAEEAIALDPDEEEAWIARGRARMSLSQFAEAESDFRKALSINPDDEVALNLLSILLHHQGRGSESASVASARLAEEPNDAFAHANLGYVELRNRNLPAAMRHFEESLRLNPNLDYARHGMLEAYRARSPLYRAFLTYSEKMLMLSQGKRTMFFIGAYVVYRVASSIAGGISSNLVWALMALYMTFAMFSYVSRGLATLCILPLRRARLALTRQEFAEGIVVGGLFLVALLVLIPALIAGSEPMSFFGVGLLMLVFPWALCLMNDDKTGQKLYGAIGIVASLAVLIGGYFGLKTGEPMNLFGAIGMILAIGSTWLGLFGVKVK